LLQELLLDPSSQVKEPAAIDWLSGFATSHFPLWKGRARLALRPFSLNLSFEEGTMKNLNFLSTISGLAAGAGLAILSMAQAHQPPELKKEAAMNVGGYKVSGPYNHENLSIFLIHGKDSNRGKTFLTLQEALEQKKVVVHETSQVNELAIENVSPEEIYIQSGDIVKGGMQDRVLTYDFIVPAKSGKIPISAFCVEHGRWRQRGQEKASAFGTSSDQLSTKDLKLAAKYRNNQSEVWKKVAVAQGKLSAGLAVPVSSAESNSSLQLTLENKNVRESSQAYIRHLSPIIEEETDVVGYAFAINGKFNSADVYASGELFRKLWPKLLKASAVEALAEAHQDKKFEPASREIVTACLTDAEQGQASEKQVNSRTKMVTQETGRNLLFETRDQAQKGAWIHRNYLSKE